MARFLLKIEAGGMGSVAELSFTRTSAGCELQTGTVRVMGPRNAGSSLTSATSFLCDLRQGLLAPLCLSFLLCKRC